MLELSQPQKMLYLFLSLNFRTSHDTELPTECQKVTFLGAGVPHTLSRPMAGPRSFLWNTMLEKITLQAVQTLRERNV